MNRLVRTKTIAEWLYESAKAEWLCKNQTTLGGKAYRNILVHYLVKSSIMPAFC